MLFNLHNSTRHFPEKRERLGKWESQNKGGNEALVHYLALAKRKRRLPSREPPSPQVPSAPWHRPGGRNPRHNTSQTCWELFLHRPIRVTAVAAYFRACQNKQIIDTVLAGRWKEQEVLLKRVAQKTDLSTTTRVPKWLRIPRLCSRPRRAASAAPKRLCPGPVLLGRVTALSPSEGPKSPNSHEAVAAAKQVPLLSFRTFKYFSWFKFNFVFHFMSISTVSKAQTGWNYRVLWHLFCRFFQVPYCFNN